MGRRQVGKKKTRIHYRPKAGRPPAITITNQIRLERYSGKIVRRWEGMSRGKALLLLVLYGCQWAKGVCGNRPCASPTDARPVSQVVTEEQESEVVVARQFMGCLFLFYSILLFLIPLFFLSPPPLFLSGQKYGQLR